MNWNKLQLGVTILGAVIMALVGLERRARAAGAEAQAQRRLKITQRQQEEAGIRRYVPAALAGAVCLSACAPLA